MTLRRTPQFHAALALAAGAVLLCAVAPRAATPALTLPRASTALTPGTPTPPAADRPSGAPRDSSSADVGPDPTAAVAHGRAAVLTLRGRVTDRAGRHVGAVQVFAEGSRRAEVAAGRDGAWLLPVPLGTLDSLLRSPAEIWLDARALGMRIDLAGGASRLRFEIRTRDDSVGGRHVVVRSNDAAFTRGVATALRDGALDDTVEVRFVAVPGSEAPPQDVAMNEAADVVVAPGSLPLPFLAGAAPPADTGAVGPGAGGAGLTPEVGDGVTPGIADTGTVVVARRDTCGCRIEGTFEVQWDRPLRSRVPVELWLEDAPAVRDSIELLLGSPRAFLLEARGCAPQRVAYRTHSRMRFARVTPDPVVRCDGARVRQLRIVLRPVVRIP